MAEEKKVSTEKVRTVKTKGKDRVTLGKFLKETIVELKKVVWPTKKQLFVNTTIVIVVSILAAAYFAGFDGLFNYIYELTLAKR